MRVTWIEEETLNEEREILALQRGCASSNESLQLELEDEFESHLSHQLEAA